VGAAPAPGAALGSGAWCGLALCGGGPPERRQRLLEGFRKAFETPRFRQLMQERGVRLAWLEGEAFRQFVQEQSALNRALIASMGVHLTRGDVGYLYFPALLAVLGGVFNGGLFFNRRWLAPNLANPVVRGPSGTLPSAGGGPVFILVSSWGGGFGPMRSF